MNKSNFILDNVVTMAINANPVFVIHREDDIFLASSSHVRQFHTGVQEEDPFEVDMDEDFGEGEKASQERRAIGKRDGILLMIFTFFVLLLSMHFMRYS